jgi:hypothetical protein
MSGFFGGIRYYDPYVASVATGVSDGEFTLRNRVH